MSRLLSWWRAFVPCDVCWSWTRMPLGAEWYVGVSSTRWVQVNDTIRHGYGLHLGRHALYLLFTSGRWVPGRTYVGEYFYPADAPRKWDLP